MKNFKIYLILFFGLNVFGLQGCDSDEDVNSQAAQQIKMRFDKVPQHIHEQVKTGLQSQAEINAKKERTISRGIAFVGHDELTWRKEIVSVSFEGGASDVHKLIEATANKWTDTGGYLTFSFKDSNGNYRIWDEQNPETATDIRISFRDDELDGGYWSVAGNTAQFIDSSEPTMNFEGFETDLIPYFGESNDWLESYEHATILHEFGHALGLAHEHFHPDCQSDMKVKKVVNKFIAGGWSKHDAKFNIQASYYLKIMYEEGEITTGPLESDVIDQASVMLYRTYHKRFYKSGDNTPCKPLHPSGYAVALSGGDIEYYLEQYNFLGEEL